MVERNYKTVKISYAESETLKNDMCKNDIANDEMRTLETEKRSEVTARVPPHKWRNIQSTVEALMQEQKALKKGDMKGCHLLQITTKIELIENTQ